MSSVGVNGGFNQVQWSGKFTPSKRLKPKSVGPSDQSFRGAMDVVNLVQGKIDDVAKLGDSKHNQSLSKEQVMLSGYRSGVKHAAQAAGNLLVNLWSFTTLGIKVDAGMDAVLKRDDKGAVQSFEARDTSTQNGLQKHEYTVDYFKSTGDDGSSVYSVIRQTDDVTTSKRSVMVGANGTISILEG